MSFAEKGLCSYTKKYDGQTDRQTDRQMDRQTTIYMGGDIITKKIFIPEL